MDRVQYESVLVQELINAYDRDELDITPWYQRRSVWSRAQKAYLINTIHESKPVPSIYVRYVVDLESEQTIQEVVDGQQRIRCVLEFRNDEFSARHPNHRGSVRYSQLKPSERIKFLQTALAVGYLIDAGDGDVIEIFGRINSVSKTLNPQEKRNAQHSGEFKQFCLSQSIERLPFWRLNSVFTGANIARMAEVQFISDFVMNIEEGLQDFSSSNLTKYYKSHDDVYDNSESTKKRLDKIFRWLLALEPGFLNGTVFQRPDILFSLMYVLDETEKTKKSTVRNCISEIDSHVEVTREGESSPLNTAEYEAFTTGNLHRIRSRQIRHDIISGYFN